MTEEEKKAVTQLEIEYNFLNTKSKEFKDLSYLEERLKEAMLITLNLIQKQQKEIEKKDKMIDEAKQYCEKIMNYEEYEKKHSKLSREIIKIKEGLTTHYKVWRIANNIHNILLTRY